MVALLALSASVGVMAAFGLLVLAASVLPARGIAVAVVALCALALLSGLVGLLAGGRAEALGGLLAIDELAAFFLVLAALAGLAAGCGGLGRAGVPAGLPALLAASLLLVLAGSAGTALLATALFALAAAGGRLRPSDVAGLFLLAGAFALLALGHGADFAAIRARPPEGWRAAGVLVLTLLGLVSLVGWVPWHRRFLAAEATAPALAALAPAVALYLVLRITADLCGPATPGWWGVPLLLLGAGAAVLGSVGGLRAPAFGGVLAGLAVQQGGWMLIGLGTALIARSADMLPLTSLALGGALLHALNHVVFASLAGLAAQAAALGAGSQVLDRLGGLATSMKMAAAGMLVAGLSFAALPPSAGFASTWMLVQALFAAPRLGGLPLQLVVAVVIGLLGLAAGLGAVAALRLAGTAFLGRPRTPRAAAAEGNGRAQRITLAGLAVVCGGLGLFPGMALRLATPAQRLVTAAALDGQGGWDGLHTRLDSAGYLALAITAVLAIGLAGIVVSARSGRLQGRQPAPAWEDGFAAPPPWMPFGEPATQITAAALAASMPAPAVGVTWPRLRLRLEVQWPGIGPRHAGWAILVLAVLLLLAVAVLGPA